MKNLARLCNCKKPKKHTTHFTHKIFHDKNWNNRIPKIVSGIWSKVCFQIHGISQLDNCAKYFCCSDFFFSRTVTIFIINGKNSFIRQVCFQNLLLQKIEPKMINCIELLRPICVLKYAINSAYNHKNSTFNVLEEPFLRFYRVYFAFENVQTKEWSCMLLWLLNSIFTKGNAQFLSYMINLCIHLSNYTKEKQKSTKAIKE